ncbi:uncharacterized protein LOC117101102 isoform X2 [Anneissia japonica]|nr:uncharacterized protein LOC117101102 isoform X2 [Anneissia japonica]
MDIWSGRNKPQGSTLIKKKTSFKRMPEWQTNIIEETNYKEGGFDDNFSELSEMDVIFKSGLTDQEFKTVSVTAEEDDIWSSFGLFPDRIFGKKEQNRKQQTDDERDYVNIPIGRVNQNLKCNIKDSSMTDKNCQNSNDKKLPSIPSRHIKANPEHVYEEIPFKKNEFTAITENTDARCSTNILNNDDVYELYSYDEVTDQYKTTNSATSEYNQPLYAVVNKRTKTSSINNTDKHSTYQSAGNNSITNENPDSYFLTANRNSCNNIQYSVHLYSNYSTSTKMSQRENTEVVSRKERHNIEGNLYDLISNNLNENLRSEPSNPDNSSVDVTCQTGSTKCTFLLPGAISTNKDSSTKKQKKYQSEVKHISRVGSTSKNKSSVWYVEDSIDSPSSKEKAEHCSKETDSKVARVTENMTDEQSNIIILGAEVETSQFVPKCVLPNKQEALQPTNYNAQNANTLIDFDLMAESSNFSLKNHLGGQLSKDDLVQQYCDSLSDALRTEDIENEHIATEQGMKLSSTSESGLGSSYGDVLSNRACCDGLDTKTDSNNSNNMHLLEMEMSLTNTETSGYETPLSPLSPSSLDLDVGESDGTPLKRPSIAKQGESELRRLENDEKRKSFFGNDSILDQSPNFEQKHANTLAIVQLPVSKKLPSVNVLPKLNASFPRPHQYSANSSTPTQSSERVRASTDSDILVLDETKGKEFILRNRSVTESEIEELKKAHALAAKKKSSRFMKQLYFGINIPDDENCEVDENGKPLYEYEWERRQLIGSMRIKKPKEARWLDEDDSALPAEAIENKLMAKNVLKVRKEESILPHTNPCEPQITSTDDKTLQLLNDNKQEIHKEGSQVKPISVQERMELLNLNKECTNGSNHTGNFNSNSLKKKSLQETVCPVNDKTGKVKVVGKSLPNKQTYPTDKNKTMENISQLSVQADDSKDKDVENTKISMKTARNLFEHRISKQSSEGLKRRQTTPSGEAKNLAAYQSRLSLRKNDSPKKNEHKMREKILADINVDDMEVKIIEKNVSNLMVTDFEDIVDSGDTFMSYDVTHTTTEEKLRSETIVEREIRFQREREEEFSRNCSARLKKPSPQEKEKRQSIAEELEKEQEVIKAHESVVEREVREQREREEVVLRERSMMDVKYNVPQECSPSSTDRAKPIVDDTSRIIIHGLGLGCNGMPEVRVQRFSGSEEQWSRIKTTPYSSYREYQKLLRGQTQSSNDEAAIQSQNIFEEPKQEFMQNKKSDSLRTSSLRKSSASLESSSMAAVHEPFSLGALPDVIILDKETTETKKQTLTLKESTIERDIRLAQEREAAIRLQNKKDKEESQIKPQNLKLTNSSAERAKKPATKTFSSSSSCSNSSSSSISRRLAMSSMQKELSNERQKEQELHMLGIIKSLSSNNDNQQETLHKEEKKKVQVNESIIQQEIRLQKEREEAIKKEHDRLNSRPKSSYQLAVTQPEADSEISKRRSVPVTDSLTHLQ